MDRERASLEVALVLDGPECEPKASARQATH